LISHAGPEADSLAILILEIDGLEFESWKVLIKSTDDLNSL
jgi:hypothetical protein